MNWKFLSIFLGILIFVLVVGFIIFTNNLTKKLSGQLIISAKATVDLSSCLRMMITNQSDALWANQTLYNYLQFVENVTNLTSK